MVVFLFNETSYTGWSRGNGCFSYKDNNNNRPRVFENRVLRRIFGTKRDEVTEEWRKLHNEELNAVYCSPSIIWLIR